MEIEKQYQFTHKGRKFKTKYFAALGALYGEEAKDGYCKTQEGDISERRARTDQLRDMVRKK